MNLLLTVFSCVLLILNIEARKHRSFLRTYECDKGNRCQRTSQPIDSEDMIGIGQHLSLQACRLVCSTAAGLWPIPTGPIITGSNYVPIHPKSFQFLHLKDLDEPARAFMNSAIDIFLKNLNSNCGHHCLPSERKVTVYLNIESSNLKLNWNTNEAYDLEMTSEGSDTSSSVVIQAQTVYGARHALETLSQLTAPVDIINGTRLVLLDSANIYDKPVFSHRGLLVDTGRNYLTIKDMERTIDALAAAKMNILHWHATDSQSFPLDIRSLPQMTRYGAYGPDQIYRSEDMIGIKRYAQARGVRIILEIDSPSHAGAGWQWGDIEGFGSLAVCVDRQPWREYCIQPPCGQLNPVNPNTYDVLRKIYRELIGTFGRNGMMHLGGDELFMNCWNTTDEVTDGMSRMGLGRKLEDFLKIWSYVHNRQLDMLNEEAGDDKSQDKAIVWSSQLTDPEVIETYLNKSRFVVQTWVEADKELNKRLLDLGYQLIISTKDAWYLDHGFWGVTRYHSWRDAYNNVIPQMPGVLGGEACMWGEYVSGGALDSKVWPRAAAVAERLWSDPTAKKGTIEAEPRLQAQIERLRRRGIIPDAIAPEWCSQHEGLCL